MGRRLEMELQEGSDAGSVKQEGGSANGRGPTLRNSTRPPLKQWPPEDLHHEGHEGHEEGIGNSE